MNLSFKSILVNTCISVALITCYHFAIRQNNYAFIDNAKIYDGFKMKIHYQKEIESKMLANKNKLDSLYLQLKMLTMQTSEGGLNAATFRAKASLQDQIKKFQIEATTEAEHLSEKYENQIWSQINQYVREYGKKHHIKILFGAAGNGNLMYADEAVDYTESVLTYINQKYEQGE